jgi:hypothetical protein
MKILSMVVGVMLALPLVSRAASAPDIDFGDDASKRAHNGECNDSRFSGPGLARELLRADRFHDASDCSALYQRGLLRLTPVVVLPLQSGETQQGHLLGHGNVDYYRYQGSADALLMVDLISSAFDPYLTVVSPSGNPVSNDEFAGDPNHSRLLLRLSETGEYLVQVSDQFRETDGGDYTLTLLSAAIIADDEYEGSLENGDDLLDTGEYADTWTFAGKRGELVSIRLNAIAFKTFLILKAPDGKIETDDISFTFASRIERELPMTGTYTVRVTSGAAGKTGAYLLRIIRSEVSH